MERLKTEIGLEAVLDTLVDGVIIINGLGTMRLFNPACTEIFGYDPSEVLGQNIKMLMPEPYHSGHDGPMAASINYLETAKLLLARDGDLDKEKLLDITSRAIEQTHRASDIISRMRGFIEKGDVEKSANDLTEVVETARRLAFLTFDQQNIEVRVDVPASLPKVFINSIQVQQVLVNLMKNACEAMSDSDPKLLDILAVMGSCGTMIEVQVKDTGRGLSDQDIETLFVPFSSGKSEGMGVGLSISQSIVTHHDGQIWATPNTPAGTMRFPKNS